MKTTLAYLLALASAQVGALLGFLLSGAFLMPLAWHGLSHPRVFSLRQSTGNMGHVQRAVLGFGRALAALLAAGGVLLAFHLRLTAFFAALAIASLVAWDVYGAVLRVRGWPGRSPDPAYVASVQSLARVIIPVNVAVSVLAAWLLRHVY